MADVVTYKCPSCGGPLAFGIDGQKWSCHFCGGDFTKDDLDSQESAPPEAEPPQGEQLGGEAKAYECPSCGGRILTDQVTAATFCVYCHNPTIIASRLTGALKPDYIIPFKLKKEAAVEAVQKLCKWKPLLPKAFQDSVENGEVSGLYVPFWLFDSDLTASMEANAQNIKTWSDSHYRYTKTDFYNVVRVADMSVRGIPADGSRKMDDKLLESMEPYNYSEIREFAMEYISGHYAEAYDVSAEEARERIIPRIKEGASGVMKNNVGPYTTYQVKRLDVNTRKLSHRYALLPVWTLMHEFNGKQYYFAMNGQTGKMTGKLPVSPAKAVVLFAVGWAAIFLLLFLTIVL